MGGVCELPFHSCRDFGRLKKEREKRALEVGYGKMEQVREKLNWRGEEEWVWSKHITHM